MKKNNIILSILFSITFLLTVFSLTAMSKNFVKRVFVDNNYYEVIEKNINKNEYGIEIDASLIKKDLNKYINSRYMNTYFVLPNNKDNKNMRDYYNENIKFLDYLNFDVNSLIYIIYIITILFIIVTGLYFNKTKGSHKLSVIIVSNFLVSVLIFGLVKIYFSSESTIVNAIIARANAYYLATSIILLDIIFLKEIFLKFK